jgi:hypothetical protein
MKRLRGIHIAVAALLVVALLLGTWQSISAQFITNDTWAIGRQGIFVPGGFSQDNVELTRVHQSEVRGGPVIFKRPLLRLQYFNNEGSSLGIPFALTYVFYNLHGFEVRDWERGNLGIWYLDTTTSTWRSCNAFQTKLQNGDARIACVAPQSTLFGLGKEQ